METEKRRREEKGAWPPRSGFSSVALKASVYLLKESVNP